MNYENWNWAVWAVLTICALNIITGAALIGRSGKIGDRVATILAATMTLTLLYFGGFFE